VSAILYHIHDPMCSWCWGFRPVWDELQQNLPESVVVENVVGGLAKDTDEPMPIAKQEEIQGYWRQIETLLSTEFNFDFWQKNTPRRSTFMACRAVLAAKNQGLEAQMINAIQRGYYLRAMNPSDISVLVLLAAELGIDQQKFASDLQSAELSEEFSRQLALTRAQPINGFPSLLLEYEGERTLVNVDYKNYQVMLSDIDQLLS